MNERLYDLLTELGKHFGKTTRWKVRCLEEDAATEEHKIRLAEEVLAVHSTGTVAEWHSFQLRARERTGRFAIFSSLPASRMTRPCFPPTSGPLGRSKSLRAQRRRPGP